MALTKLRMAATGTVATVAIGTAVLVGGAGAQADDSSRQIKGTWRVVVQPDGAPPAAAFESLIVYTSSGSVVEATSKAPNTTGLGVWERLGSGRYATSIEKYRFHGATYAGKTVIEEVQEIEGSGNRYTGRATVTVLDAAGNVMTTFSASATGSRMPDKS